MVGLTTLDMELEVVLAELRETARIVLPHALGVAQLVTRMQRCAGSGSSTGC